MESVVSVRREHDDSRTSCLERQNTAECAQIPGKDGGRPQKVPFFDSGLEPTAQADKSSLCPSADGGWIWQARRVLAVRRGPFGGITGREVIACLLSAMKAVAAGWR
jgi:hypothetical protein